MKILFIVPSYKPAFIYGGPTVVIALLAEQLVRVGHEVTVYTTSANGAAELDVKLGIPVDVDGVTVFYFKRITKDHTHISPSLWEKLNKSVKDFDIVHIHSWWNILVMVSAWICKRKGVKPILSPHGMFSKYILETNNSRSKTLIHSAFGKKLLKNTVLHVSTQLEWEECQQIVSGWEGMIIPNLVLLSNAGYTRNENNEFTIGFLSRIDPKKGVDVLMKALSKVSFSFKLKIAGDGNPDYVTSLKQLSQELNIDDKIEWVGWKKENDKFQFLSEVDLFVLTSHSENFAIVVIEALSVGTPVLISDQVGLFKYVIDKKLGWVTNLKNEKITEKLNEIRYDTDALKRISAHADLVINQDFNYAVLANRYLDLYQSYLV